MKIKCFALVMSARLWYRKVKRHQSTTIVPKKCLQKKNYTTLQSRQQQGRFLNILFHCSKKGSVNFGVSVIVLCVHETQN